MLNFLSWRAGRGALVAALSCVASLATQAADEAGSVQTLVDDTIRPLMARYDSFPVV